MPITPTVATHLRGSAPRRRRRGGTAVPVDQLGLDDEAARELYDDLATLARAGLIRPVDDDLEPTDATLRFALVETGPEPGAPAADADACRAGDR